MSEYHEGWLKQLRFNPLPALCSQNSLALRYFTRRDLLGEAVEDVSSLWELPEVARLLSKQLPDGSWKYSSRRGNQRQDYDQLETYRQFAILIEKYAFDRRSLAVERAAEFFFSRQTDEGDFRGIYAAQYAPTYSPAISELLIKAGYAFDARLEKSLIWLLKLRQFDGGWAFPLRTLGIDWKTAAELTEPLQPDRSKPFSHLATGTALRALAAHSIWRASGEARQAGELLTSRFFKPDRQIDRSGKQYWEKACFPFWFTDLVSALDSLSQIGFQADHPAIREALDWLSNRQQPDGFFDLKYIRSGGDHLTSAWVCLAICRILKRLDAAT